ncbi:MAG: phage portal protein [Actinomycetaceae bacterium]|nr:phage portal protein [Actinomycetaceae bacterium]
MGLLDWLRRGFSTPADAPLVVQSSFNLDSIAGMTPAALYRSQPHLRTVISFIARNIAQLPLHVYERSSDTDRKRLREDPVSLLLASPNDHMTQYELIYGLVSDLKLYDVALWLVAVDEERPAGASIYPVSPSWIVRTGGGDVWGPAWVDVQRPGQAQATRISNTDSMRFVLFHGWDPASPDGWSSPVEALKDILQEQVQAWSYRQQLWARGGRVGMYLKRPVDAPAWSPEARAKFARDWANAWSGPAGARAGGTPLLEEGMTLESTRFNAREEEWSEVAKLALTTVAGVYHINPTMLGQTDGANYSNVKEFHKMLYQDSLGPDLAMIQQRINAFIVPFVTGNANVYVEFNLQAKLAGTFEEQAAILSSSVGAPWLSRNEARARMNLPRVDGGDEIVTPLNVLLGGQASPRDSGSQNITGFNAAAGLERKLIEPAARKNLGRVTRMIFDEAGFRSQYEQAISKAITDIGSDLVAYYYSGPGSARVDADEVKALVETLSKAFYDVSAEQAKHVGAASSKLMGYGDDFFKLTGRETEFLQHRATTRAEAIVERLVSSTEGKLREGDAFKDPDVFTGIIDELTGEYRETFAPWRAVEHAHQTQNWAQQEAAYKVRSHSGGTVLKTWVTVSGDPRDEHASLDGETVSIDDDFSNGLAYPGDSSGAPEDFVNCLCALEYSYQP